MQIHIITPDRNLRGNDFDGAFDTEAKRFIEFQSKKGHNCIRKSLGYDIAILLYQRAIELPCDWLVFFCHGTSKWLFRAPFNIDNVVYQNTQAKIVTAYACSAAHGILSPVEQISKNTQIKWADGHLVSGHTTSNPLVCRWINGKPIIFADFLGKNKFKSFSEKLANRHDSNFRFEYPQMELEQIKAIL